MKSIYLTAICFLLSFLCFAQEETNSNWERVNDLNAKVKYYISKTFYSRTSEGITEWVKTEKPHLELQGETYYNVTLKSLYLFDCKNNRIKSLQIVVYDSNKDIIGSYKSPEAELEWSIPIPDSAGDMLLKKVCEYFN